MLVTSLVVLAVIGLPLALPTALGARKRGAAGLRALLVGLVWPVTWAVWYVKDERPHRRPT